MTPKEYLRQVYILDKKIDSKLTQISKLRSLAERVTPVLSPTPHGADGGDRMASAIDRLIDYEREIDADIDRLVDLKREIADVLENVANAEQRQLLELRYLAGMSWPDIALHMGYTERHIYRLHGIALLAVNMSVNVSKQVCYS
ncbi:MAG: hypothetical protein RRY79_04975 [Clostridia bacterium]